MAGSRAPSVILYYEDNEPGQLLMQDVHVPSDGLTKCTYYCCLQWNAGQDGGGYCGIQDHPDGRVFIFSMWDPVTPTDEKIKATYIGHDTQISRFGGEGTGLKSMNFSIGWEPDRWYTVVVRRWDDAGHSHFGFWVFDHTAKIWRHLATFDYPLPNICFKTRTACFIEDWLGTGEHTRCALYRNGFKQSFENRWIPFNGATFFVNQEKATECYNENYDGGIKENVCYYIKSGGSCTKPSNVCGPKTCLSLKYVDAKMEPTISPIDFEVLLSPTNKVTWNVHESSTPQLSASVKIVKATISDPETREIDIDDSGADELELTLTDIFGREVSKKMLLNK